MHVMCGVQAAALESKVSEMTTQRDAAVVRWLVVSECEACVPHGMAPFVPYVQKAAEDMKRRTQQLSEQLAEVQSKRENDVRGDGSLVVLCPAILRQSAFSARSGGCRKRVEEASGRSK